tara:strand:- start:1240 stop:1707 length:468 start_codon:yes stop_codon:yes gene_type:complete
MKALDLDFNRAVIDITNRLVPEYHISKDAPNTYEDMQAYYIEYGQLCIYNGASDNTIFADSKVNIAFRAWHDYYHMTKEIEFTELGEYEVSKYQSYDLIFWCIDNNKQDKIKLFLHLLDIEINDQVKFFNENNYFIEDQHKFTLEQLDKRGLTIA